MHQAKRGKPPAREPTFPSAAVVIVVMALGACSGGESTTSAPTVASIQVSPSTAGAGAIGQTVQFSASAKDGSGNVVSGVSFTWSSSQPGVATVDGAGLVTAVTNGSTIVSAGAQGMTGSGSLSVMQQPAAVTIVSGNAQSGLAREPLAAPLRIRVVDARSNPIPAYPVAWDVLSGGGTLVGSSADGTGHATATWTLGPTQGAGSAQATAGPVQAVLSATSLPNGVIQGVVSPSSAYLSPARMAVAVKASLAPVVRAPMAAGKPTAPSARPPAPIRSGSRGSVPGELLVRVRTSSLGVPSVGSLAYRAPVQAESASRVLRAAAARWVNDEPLEVLGASPALATVRVRVPPNQMESVRQRLLARPEVEAVEANAIAWTMSDRPWRGTSYAPAAAANEPDFTLQAWHYDVIQAHRAWEVTTGSSSVIVAVVDDGIRFDHPDIADNLRSDGYDFVSDQPLVGCTSGVYSTSMDGDGYDPDPTIPASLALDPDLDCVLGSDVQGGHGLHVAGTIGARAGNGLGGVGVAWQVGIRPIRVLGSSGAGTDYDIAQGILYAAGLPADDGAGGTVQPLSRSDIINLSLGGPSTAAVLENAVFAASNAGSLLVAAAGNDGSSSPHYPAAYPEVLSVSAVGPDFTLATYSNFGSTVDLAAPGGEQASGDDHAVWSLQWDFQSNNPAYDALQGTSMAAPHVSGVAALVLAATAGLTAAQIRARLLDHATDLGPTGHDVSFGAGLVNASASVRNGAGAPSDTYVWVIDAQSGSAHGPALASAGGGFSIKGLQDGTYRVYAGRDRNGDGRTGVFDRLWGALGGTAAPSSITIAQSSIHTASFDFGFPLESETNGTLPTANSLIVGGYMYGVIESSVDVDLYRFTVDAGSSIVVETDALFGACGLADQVDTVVRVLDAAGNPVAENDDIDTATRRHCSRVQTTLAAGTYYVEVTGWGGDVGYYAVRVGRS